MNKAFYLSTCNTCKRIFSEVELPNDFPLQDLKSEPLSVEQVETMKNLAGSYEALFNRRSQLYRQRNLKEKNLTEKDYKELLLDHYTFLKRPVFTIGGEIFIGNAKKTVAAVKSALNA